jgi:hypothetical protein
MGLPAYQPISFFYLGGFGVKSTIDFYYQQKDRKFKDRLEHIKATSLKVKHRLDPKFNLNIGLTIVSIRNIL